MHPAAAYCKRSLSCVMMPPTASLADDLVDTPHPPGTMIDTSLSDLTPGESWTVPGLADRGLGEWKLSLHAAHAVTWREAQRVCRYQVTHPDA